MLYFLIAALLFNNIYSCSGNYYENKLKTEILKDYNKFTIPSNKSLVNLQMGIAFRAFNNIDQIDGTLTTNIWLRHYWKDDYLTWNPSDYDNITEITLPTNPDMDASIWVPDIYLYNNGIVDGYVSSGTELTSNTSLSPQLWNHIGLSFLTYNSTNLTANAIKLGLNIGSDI